MIPIELDEAQLTRLVDQARAAFTPGIRVRGARPAGSTPGSGSPPNAQQATAALDRLSRALIEPLRESASDRAHWVIIPHGPLHALPFAALQVHGKPLVQQHTLSTLGNASLLVASPVDGMMPTERASLLALGNPTPPGPQWPRLPAAEAEVLSIASIYGAQRTRVLTGDMARRAALVGQTLRRQSLHLALHGEMRSADQSRLVLADGYMSVRDIWALNLQDAPMVVLSACETGLGDALTGNEVLSLANGFLFAGARNVVASLWRVPDEDTRLLMEAYYKAVMDKRAPAEARAIAQRQAMASGVRSSAWAAFTVHGF